MTDTKLVKTRCRSQKGSGQFRTVASKVFTSLLSRNAKLMAVILKKRANTCKNINGIVELDFKIFRNLSLRRIEWKIQPAQVKEEFMGILKILAKLKPTVILEIGTATGGTFFALSRLASPDGVLVSVDLPHGLFGGGYPEWRIPLYKSFAMHNQQISLIREDSHAPSTLRAVKAVLGGRKLDVLFIDGDHTYNGVKMDFEMYHNLVRRGGVIAFHDICRHPPETGCEVNKFWCEIKEQYVHDEVIKDNKQGWAGIGVIYV